MSTENIILYGCGDVGPVHEPVSVYSTLARPVLEKADIRFAQVERVYSERGSLQVHAEDGAHSRLKPAMSEVLSDCAFNVVSLASNHGMDWGEEALLDSIALFRKKGIKTVGAGHNLEEARQPAIIERNGVRVAILAYCSVLRDGYAAGPTKPGIAPLRVHTYYEPVEYQAGVPPRIVTIPYEEDLQGMVADIGKAKRSAHAVVVSLHWGVHFIPRLIAEYQTIVAKGAFDADFVEAQLSVVATSPVQEHLHRACVCCNDDFSEHGAQDASSTPARSANAPTNGADPHRAQGGCAVVAR